MSQWITKIRTENQTPEDFHQRLIDLLGEECVSIWEWEDKDTGDITREDLKWLIHEVEEILDWLRVDFEVAVSLKEEEDAKKAQETLRRYTIQWKLLKEYYRKHLTKLRVKKKNYKIEVYKLDTYDGFKYFAHYPSIKGISGGGDTASEAIEVLENIIDEHIEFLMENGYPIPDPDFDWSEE